MGFMKTEILENIDNPEQLECLYRENKTIFLKEFNLIYPDLKGNILADAWHHRLNFENSETSWGKPYELIYLIIACLFAGTIAKLPTILNIDPELFYSRNTSFIILPILTTYFLWKNKPSQKRMIYSISIILCTIIFVNILPDSFRRDNLILTWIHVPLFLWTILGTSFVGQNLNDYSRRIEFLRFNGDFIVMTTIILIAGGIMTGITVGLFQLIDVDISKFYFDYFGVYGLAAAPILGTYLTQTNPHLVNKVSPIIAKLFTPLVLITLIIYLVAIIVTGKDPYNDRDFLMTFNFLLLGVMALILFSVAETSIEGSNRWAAIVLFALSLITIIINGIAISAILFRISEWGITPNRMAVLGANLLVLANLILVCRQLFKTISRESDLIEVENTIAKFLPCYGLWTIVVSFVFPFLFKLL
jgi:hypothetical protein